MRKNILSSLLLTAIIIFSVGCKTKKVIIAVPPVISQDKVELDKKPENLIMLKSKNLDFSTLALKGKAELDINGEQNSVAMNIRIQKDKKIWVIVTAAGGIVEVARAMITPDSLFLLNKLEKTFIKKPFNYIYGYTNKQINFELLQAVLSGNAIPDFMTVKSNLIQENGVWLINGTSGDLAYQSIFNTLLKVSETTLNDAKAGQAFKVSYGKYTPINSYLFPSSLIIRTQSGIKKINIEIDFSKVERNVPVDFPFSVPKNYELIK